MSEQPQRSGSGPSRRPQSDSLADVVEMVLDKGVVINADIVVTIGETELLGIRLRAALASFDTAAQYGLEFPEGTDARRLERASGRASIEDIGEAQPIDVTAPVGESEGSDADSDGDARDGGDAEEATDADEASEGDGNGEGATDDASNGGEGADDDHD
ncbi:gas vesicle protein GvpJ [Halomarina halobia]|uniref:Gas vesicle protein GvpJ n=1 Tax=Halomarina halobia TaxID=3033386 RepID=A0ABD6A4E8_9EURY|nr:gas vesicle protein [Halomarina sp. PSR21]